MNATAESHLLLGTLVSALNALHLRLAVLIYMFLSLLAVQLRQADAFMRHPGEPTIRNLRVVLEALTYANINVVYLFS